jgi:hypothetical protein
MPKEDLTTSIAAGLGDLGKMGVVDVVGGMCTSLSPPCSCLSQGCSRKIAWREEPKAEGRTQAREEEKGAEPWERMWEAATGGRRMVVSLSANQSGERVELLDCSLW